MGHRPGGQARAGRRPHRVRQDTAAFRALDRLASGAPPPPRSTAAGSCTSRRSRRSPSTSAQPPLALGRHPPGGATAAASGADITVGMRTGDTPADERRRFARTPPDVLVTTPESLFLLLTSAARDSLRGVTTVILDEVHAVAGTKRGAHLALSLERLDELLEQPAQRIGLSATVRPLDEVSTFLAGARPVEVVQPRSPKTVQVSVEVPVPDLPRWTSGPPPAAPTRRWSARLRAPPGGRRSGPRSSGGCWSWCAPTVHDRVRQLETLAERLTSRLNELAAEEVAEEVDGVQDLDAFPAEAIGRPASAVLRRPPWRRRTSSMSREQRTLVEEELKGGVLPCVVATSSLELGIDMGAVDLVSRSRRRRAWRRGCSGWAARAIRSARCREGGVPEVPR